MLNSEILGNPKTDKVIFRGFLKNIFEPLGDELLTIMPVSSMVNNPRNEGPDCVEPSKTTANNANQSVQKSLDFTR
jgi:hypothetical protein